MFYNKNFNYNDIMQEIYLIKKILFDIYKNQIQINKWLSKKHLKLFFDYSDSQIREFEKNSNLVVSKIGRRKFYSVESILKIIEAGVIKKAN